MKKSIILIAFIFLAFTGCKTQQQASTSANDDVYANPKYSAKHGQTVQKDVDLSAPQQVATPDSSSTAKSGSWYNDYNDYSKSTQPQETNNQSGSSSGTNNTTYVDPNVYDNTYSSNPDVNVYIGSSYDPFFWGSTVSIGCGFDWGWNSFYWGFPYSSWYYPYYGYYPYFGYYPNYYGGWGGYWDGFHDSYWYGHHENPFHNNSYSSYYYGQRRMLSSGGDGSRQINPRRILPTTPAAIGVNQRTLINPQGTRINEPTTRPGSETRRNLDASGAVRGQANTGGRFQNDPGGKPEPQRIPADRQHYRFDRTRGTQSYIDNRNEKPTPGVRPNNQNSNPAPRNNRTGDQSSSTRVLETQNYSSPAYRQPKYSQEYSNPRSQGNGGIARESTPPARGTSGVDNRSQTRRFSDPSQNSRRYSSPSNSMNNQRSYSPPTRSNSSSGFSSPTRSYSSPNTNSGTRSGGGSSFSAPSRSGSSGNSSRGNGGGGSGGGRRK